MAEDTLGAVADAIAGPFNRYRLQYLVRLWLARLTARDLYRDHEPLVSVLIPTYNRARLLAERSVASVGRQSYQRFAIVVVCDACTDDTEAVLHGIGDPRISFHNLSVRGPYPEDPYRRWLVAGSAPGNEPLRRARGRWIAWLDDDDEFCANHIETLLTACLSGQPADMRAITAPADRYGPSVVEDCAQARGRARRPKGRDLWALRRLELLPR